MSKKSETYGAVWAAIVAILLFLFLFFCTIVVKFPNEGGVEVNFGDVLESAGLYEPAPAEVIAEPTPTPPAAQPAPPVKSVTQPVQTQDFEESLAMKQAKEEARKKQEQEKALEKARQEQIRQEQERIAEEKRKAEEKAAKATAISNRAKGAFSGAGNGTSASEGTSTAGTGNEGNPLGGNSKNTGVGGGSGSGSGTSVGRGTSASYNLGNRKVSGTIPRPSDNTQVVGKIVVEIAVDASGNVISATIGQGTNITETSARSAALAAARKAKFTSGDRTEIGVITYNYKIE